KVAYRCAVRARARSQGRKRHTALDLDLPALAVPDAGLAAAEQSDLWPLLDQEIQHLTEKERTAFVLCYLEGNTYAEAARQLGCPRSTIATRLTRAREVLQRRLAARGVALPAGILAGVLCAQAATAAPDALVEATVNAVSSDAAVRAV